MAATGVRYDEGASTFTSNCFPVRSFYRQNLDGDGAWLTAYQAEQRKRFKAILCSRPKTYSQIREERKRCEREGTKLTADKFKQDEEDDIPTLDGFFLMKHCCVEDPSDLCSVNIAGKEISEVKEEDFALFDNVAYVNAGENYLPFEAFRGFQTLRELEMPLNGLRCLKIDLTDFPHLELLDLSYNNLSHEDVLLLGLLQNLKVLHLSGNNFTSLPADMALPYISQDRKYRQARYPKLEILMIDDNRLSDVTVFAALAGLQRLKHLNMEKNLVYYVPQLKSVEGKVVTQESIPPKKFSKSARKSGRSSQRSRSAAHKDSGKKATPTNADEGKVSEDTKEAESDKAPVAVTVIKEDVTDSEPPQPVSEENTGDDLLNADLSLNLGNITERMNALQGNSSGDVSYHGGGMEELPAMSLCAFPELRYISLAFNKIEDEEGLLAVAAWPMLMELVIHDNPLTTDNSGDPPLLKRFLQDRLGIQIVRKLKKPIQKPVIDVPVKKHRKVRDHVPKVPRPPLEERLMLMGPEPHPPAKVETKERSDVSSANIQTSKPLPPIGTKLTKPEDKESERPTETAWTDEQTQAVNEQTQPSTEDAFFMTQVNEQEEETTEQKQETSQDKGEKPSMTVDRYEGYEELLTMDDVEVEDVCPAKDIQGNLRALKLALNYPLVYRDPSARLDTVPRQVKEYRRVPMPPPRAKTKAQRVNEVLHELKTRSTVDEAPLSEVMSGGDPDMRKQFPEAENLLAEIQSCYNTVRVDSMKHARHTRKVVGHVLESVKSSGVKLAKLANEQVTS
ncbi:X-ray radiation resistance-associated protein 1-like [Gigantopelta aegis]|uniref:X-ray radiation resistance-associated protein 1-like n=1 Tax=Gigantopelta aegis TaxID=1735272 RepID=UPI001B888003|nr:X-ray radiation resistance-associated protein 1-like [Gigantopelta aegis]